MNFEFTQDQNIFYESVRKFAGNELAADAVARANSDTYPWDVAKKFSEMGLLGITIPENKGGIGGTLMDAILPYRLLQNFVHEVRMLFKLEILGLFGLLPNMQAKAN